MNQRLPRFFVTEHDLDGDRRWLKNVVNDSVIVRSKFSAYTEKVAKFAI
ncbi:MAG: hypothetical protein HC910_09610 [Spirulinaceae cyanobacterium SM2_1_0]|nr:hypothetical protein [Spirulinaceae cyanobacterium SM2_1_0]